MVPSFQVMRAHMYTHCGPAASPKERWSGVKEANLKFPPPVKAFSSMPSAHVSLVRAVDQLLPHKLKTGPCIFLVCQFNKHAYQDVCSDAQRFFFYGQLGLRWNVFIF